MTTIDIPLSTLNKTPDESESESDCDLDKVQQPTIVEEQVDPNQLQWFPWMWFYVKRSAKTTYKVCDDAGEKLAWFLGITKPKYYGEIQEFQRMDEEEREAWRQEFQDVQQTNEIVNAIVTVPPQTTDIYTISNQNEVSHNI